MYKPQLHKQLTGVDVIKFIMAFGVVAIHVNTNSVAGGAKFPFIIQWIISLAVPFFFICSGYLIGQRATDTTKAESSGIFRSKSRALVRIFLSWLIIYLPVSISNYSFEHVPLKKAIFDYITSVLINGESPYAWPLWFIYSMAITFFILSFFRITKKNILCFFLSFLLITLFNAFDYDNAILKMYKILFHRSLQSGVFIMGGMLIQSSRYRIDKLAICIMLLISVALRYFNLPLSDLIGGIALFATGLKLTFSDFSRCIKLRQLSMWIYYTHMLVLYPLIL